VVVTSTYVPTHNEHHNEHGNQVGFQAYPSVRATTKKQRGNQSARQRTYPAMTEAQDVAAVLSKLQASTRTRTEKWAKIEASLGPIFAARDRGVSWHAIAEALREVGIDVHRETLRLFVQRHPRDLKAHPRTIAGPPKRRRRLNARTRATKSNAALAPGVAENPQLETEPPAQVPADPPPTMQTAPVPKSGSTSKPSEFAGIRRLNARK
jgi:hypothetical protein